MASLFLTLLDFQKQVRRESLYEYGSMNESSFVNDRRPFLGTARTWEIPDLMRIGRRHTDESERLTPENMLFDLLSSADLNDFFFIGDLRDSSEASD